MLEHLTITGGACFGDDPLDLQGFKKVNFFFGANGSGKTTISRALAGYESLAVQQTWRNGFPLKVKVYNRDFVDRMLKESNRIPGVFVIGKRSVEAETRLQAIESIGGERSKAGDILSRAMSSLAAAQTANEDAQKAFRESAWESYQQLMTSHPTLKPAFTGKGGVGNSKQSLIDRLIVLEAGVDPVSALESLTSDAEAVFDTTAETCVELPRTVPFDAKSFDGYGLLVERIVGSDEVSLSELITRLGNSDWVSTGRKYLEHSEGLCPFCQKKAPENLLSGLAAMYNDEYTTKKEQVEQFVDAFMAWSTEAVTASMNFDDSARSFLDEAAYQTALVSLRTEVTKNRAALEKKKQNLSSAVAFTDLGQLVAELDRRIDLANTTIKAHNDLISNRRTEQPNLVNRCWQYLAFKELDAVLSLFKKKQAGRDRGTKKLSQDVEEAKGVIAQLDIEVRALQNSVRSTQTVIDRINALLDRSGFTSFKIVPSSELADGYMLSRGNGVVQEQSLSEGERTFIAFLYFFHLLDEETSESEGAQRILAVIDDPVSSLDSEVLFIVGALIRQIIARVLTKEDHIEQMLILTHNVYFHKDISHVGHNDSEAGRTYFVIRKRHGSSSEIIACRENPVSTEYRRLWNEVKRALDGEQMNIVGLENILRRILESYFRVMGGGIWIEDIVPLLEYAERPAFQALFRWANEGSHSILEELHFTPTPINQDVYLQVFKRIFEVTDNDGHYRMMVEGKRSLVDATVADADL